MLPIDYYSFGSCNSSRSARIDEREFRVLTEHYLQETTKKLDKHHEKCATSIATICVCSQNCWSGHISTSGGEEL